MKEDLMEAKKLEPKEKIEPNTQKENYETEIIKEEQKEISEKLHNTEQSPYNDEIKKEDIKDSVEEEVDLEELNKVETDKNQDNEEEKEEDEKNHKEMKKGKRNKSKENNIEKQKMKNCKKIIISIIIVAIVVSLFSTVFALININNEKIISGITINEIEVSGLTKEEAIAKLETIYSEKMENNIMLQYGEFETELNKTLMEVSYNIEKTVYEAYALGRNGNIFINNYDILGTLIWKKDFGIDMTINEEITKQTISDIGANLPGIMIDSSYSIEEDELIITRGKEGIVISGDTLLEQVKEKLKNIHETENVIEIPVETKRPQEIDIEKIHNEIYKEPQNAYYTQEPFTVYPEVKGIDFDVEKAKEIISAEVKDEYVIKLTITKPQITLQDIGTEAFPDKLSTFSTRYDASDRDRTTNLVIACQKINGTVLMPGKTFSYNEALGPRTYSAGYRNGKIYANGEVVDGLGGGICQISSTLYNSALMSDMEIIERRNHQFVTSYVDKGRDATVVYGATDFKFKNTRTYPVRIVASAKGGVATVSIYGIKESDREYTYSFKTELISTIPYTTKYTEDSSLAVGKEVVTQRGVNGLICKTYMTKMLNGKIISTKLLSTDTYSAMQKIVKRGKKVANKNVSNNTTNKDKEINNEEIVKNPEETLPTQPPEEIEEEKQETQNETIQ